MKQIAYLTIAELAVARMNDADRKEHTLQFEALATALAARAVQLEPLAWDQEGVDWTGYDAVLIGTTWDYSQRREAFLGVLDGIERAGARLFNAARVVHWNIDKRYLHQLEQAGIPTVPTLWANAPTAEAIARGFDHFGVETIIVKPCVSAGAWRLCKLVRGEPMPPAEQLPLGACMIQPFLDGVQSEGEVSLLLYDGEVSHGVRKVPASGDFRVQSSYGAREAPHAPTNAERDLATRTLRAAAECVGEELLYARVDLIPGPEGAPRVIELEAIEPYHYVEQGPEGAPKLAEALMHRL